MELLFNKIEERKWNSNNGIFGYVRLAFRSKTGVRIEIARYKFSNCIQ